MLNPNFTTKVEEDSDTHGKFELGSLPVSFGQSFGNALRRVLLSALPGLAVTSIKIEGASHLFTTLKGVKESVLEIVLNLKQLRFDATEGDGPFHIHLVAKKAGKLYGKDVEGDIKIVNEDMYLGEITDNKGKLEVEAVVEKGQGYLPVEDRETIEFGFIPVDAFFSPVKKVNFTVKEAAGGRKSGRELLVLEIWTDGSIKPSMALRQSAQTLSSYFGFVLSGKDSPQKTEEEMIGKEKKDVIDQKLYEIIIDELNLPSRVINALLRENIETVADLVKVGRERLTNMKGVGKKSIELIEVELKKMGIELQ